MYAFSANIRDAAVDARVSGAVGVGGDGGVMAILVGVVRGGILLLLERDRETWTEVAILLGEAGVVEAGDGGGGRPGIRSSVDASNPSWWGDRADVVTAAKMASTARCHQLHRNSFENYNHRLNP